MIVPWMKLEQEGSEWQLSIAPHSIGEIYLAGASVAGELLILCLAETALGMAPIFCTEDQKIPKMSGC